MKAFLIPPTESDQKDTDLKAVGVKSMKIGEILNMGRESVAITGAYKSDSHHLLHRSGSGQELRSPLFCPNFPKSLHLRHLFQVHSGP